MLPSAERRGEEESRGRQEEGRSSRRGWQRGQRDDLTLSEAGHVLWERRAVVVGCMLLFLAVALLYGLSRESVYEAEATLSVRLDEEGIGIAENFEEILLGLRNSGAMSGLPEEAAQRAGWEGGTLDFDERLQWERVSNEEVAVRFSAPTPEAAARAANAYAEVFVERIGELKGRLAGGTVAVNAEVEEAAEPPEQRSGLGVLVVVIASGCGGLLAGGIGALVLESRARRWRGSRDAELTLRAPVLGVIPHYSGELLGSGPRDGGASR
jgi:uncharacterized protein involved in exopolysaccharide biosynthesis